MNDGENAMIARTLPEGWHNMAIGEPGFLQEVFDGFFPEYVAVGPNSTYPPPEGLWGLRGYVGEFDDLGEPTGLHAVITNGAKQALMAAMYAAREVEGADGVEAPVPYFPSFRTMADALDLTWDPDHQRVGYGKRTSVEILTWPNNPSGTFILADRMKQPKRPNDFRIWDAVYDSRCYGYHAALGFGEVADWDVKVGSLSKSCGLSGLRIGWALFKEERYAKAAARYVETTTSGVSRVSQVYASKVFDRIAAKPEKFRELERRAALNLHVNSELFRMAMKNTLGPASTVYNGGLFCWWRPTCSDFAQKLEAAKVTMVDGTYCGVPGYWRANLGLRQDAMSKACAALAGIFGGEVLDVTNDKDPQEDNAR